MARRDKKDTYVGINNELNGGLTTIGKIIRDAWVFGLIEDTETCEGWNLAGIDALYDKVNKEWDKYGCMVSQLPPELYEKHERYNSKAIEDARALGWSGEVETDDEEC